MLKLSDLVSSEKEEVSESEEKKESIKLSDISSKEKEVSPKQAVAEDISTKVRTAIGKAGQPMKLGADLISGRLFDDDPLSQASGEIATSAVNSAAFGIPKAMTKKMLEMGGIEYPEIENKTTKTVGEFLGLIAPGKIASSIAGKIPGLAGRTIAKDIARGSTTGAIFGFTVSPDEFTDLGQRIKQAGVGAAAGAVAVPVARGLENIGKVAFKAKEFAQKVRTSLFDAKTSFGKEFEVRLNSLIERNPSQVVNLSETFSRVKDIATTNTRFKSDLLAGAKRSGLDPKVVKGFIDNPDSASQMTLNQTRELKQAISKVPSIQANLKKGKLANYSDTDIDLLDFADDIKKSQLDAFPELEGINKKYSEMISQYNIIKDKFKVGKLLDNINKNFGDAEIRGIVKQLLPKSVIQELGGYRAGVKFLNAMKWIGIVGVGTGVAAVATNKIMGSAGTSKYQEG
jgi:hypothetical protein